MKLSIEDVPLPEKWLEAKKQEQEANKRRIEIEEKMLEVLAHDQQNEGTKKHFLAGYDVKIVQRFSKKIDNEKLMEIVEKNGLYTDYGIGFRTKVDLDARGFASLGEESRKLFGSAITTSPSKPSFEVELKGE